MREIPERLRLIVGTEVDMEGPVFGRKPIERTKFFVVGIRWGSSVIFNMKTEERFPSVEYLVENETMRRPRWTRGFPVREIKLEEDE